MKHPLAAFFLLFPAIIALGTGCASPEGRASAAAADEWWRGDEASIVAVTGTVEHSADAAEWTKAFRGQAIRKGDSVRTGPGARAEINLGETTGGIVTVMPDSVVIFEQLRPETEQSEIGVVLNLPRGRVVGDTAQTAKGRKILVKTPNGTHEITADGR